MGLVVSVGTGSMVKYFLARLCERDMGPPGPRQLRSRPWDVLTLIWPVWVYVV